MYLGIKCAYQRGYLLDIGYTKRHDMLTLPEPEPVPVWHFLFPLFISEILDCSKKSEVAISNAL